MWTTKYKVGELFTTYALPTGATWPEFGAPPFGTAKEGNVANRVQLRVVASELMMLRGGSYQPVHTAIRDIFKVMRNPNKSLGTVTVMNTDMTYTKKLTDHHAVPWLNAFDAMENERALTLYADASMVDDMAFVHRIVDEAHWTGEEHVDHS